MENERWMKIAVVSTIISFVAYTVSELPLGRLAYLVSTAIFLATGLVGILFSCMSLEREELQAIYVEIRKDPTDFLTRHR